MEKNYKVALDELIRAIGDDEDMVSLVEAMVQTCKSYIVQVDSMSHAIEVARFRFDDRADYQSYVQQLDSARRRTHDSLMGTVNAVIRLGQSLSISLIPQELASRLNNDREEYYTLAKAISVQCA